MSHLLRSLPAAGKPSDICPPACLLAPAVRQCCTRQPRIARSIRQLYTSHVDAPVLKNTQSTVPVSAQRLLHNSMACRPSSAPRPNTPSPLAVGWLQRSTAQKTAGFPLPRLCPEGDDARSPVERVVERLRRWFADAPASRSHGHRVPSAGAIRSWPEWLCRALGRLRQSESSRQQPECRRRDTLDEPDHLLVRARVARPCFAK